MKASEPGESAIHLPWLAPGSLALAALARIGSSDCWNHIKHDPGAVAYVLRQLSEGAESIEPDLFTKPHLLDAAQQCLRTPGGYVDWNCAAPSQLLRSAHRIAELAETLARHTGAADPAIAWSAGMLAPLGWFGLAAVDAEFLSLKHVQLFRPTEDADEAAWNPLPLTRRLARHWHLPAAVRTTISYLNMPLDQMIAMGAPEGLAAIVQWAVTRAVNEGHRLGIAIGTPHSELVLRLQFDETKVVAHCDKSLKFDPGAIEWLNPYEQHHLTDLLHLASNQRRLEQAPYGPPVEDEIDRLQRLLANQEATENHRLQHLKLKALAEFAAGAGHEINNPLAVISGQGQYLLGRETDPARQSPLRAIIRQAERIHHILTDLMHFAKPPVPAVKTFDVRHVLAGLMDEYRWKAEPKNLQLEHISAERAANVTGDPDMVRTAIACLLRNALEAAPAGGWIRATLRAGQTVQIEVEDSGAGPNPAHRDHLFDPFFSGRTAGRGRGLGLPTAWRFAQENGGEVRFDPTPDSPARFVLSLPAAQSLPHAILRNDADHLERKSA